MSTPGSMGLERMVLVRHGETLGESSIRFHGATNVRLSELGLSQAREARRRIPAAEYELVVSSPLSRAWKTALITAPGRWVRLERDFREIHFGRWEGLTREEIAAREPELYARWQEQGRDFDFPEGEARRDFRDRVLRGLDRIREARVRSAVLVAHKGVVRTVIEALTGGPMDPELPALGGVYSVVRDPGGGFRAEEH